MKKSIALRGLEVAALRGRGFKRLCLIGMGAELASPLYAGADSNHNQLYAVHNLVQSPAFAGPGIETSVVIL